MKNSFKKFLYATNLEGSGKASSYIKAINYLQLMLTQEHFGFDDCLDIWRVISPKRIYELHAVTLEQKKNINSPWFQNDLPKSYLEKGYCSAALNAYAKFLELEKIETTVADCFLSKTSESLKLEDEINKSEDKLDSWISGYALQEGRETKREVKVRSNQSVFRKVILRIYGNTCCISGLNIPQLNIASHIIPWAERENTRLDPANGICLSATYDKAFDRHLISFDDDYRLILSRDLKEYCISEVAKQYFQDREGEKIILPKRFVPKLEYLKRHREQGVF